MSRLPTPAQLGAHLATLESGLLERATAVRLLLLSALAREHVLLIGPPGTAKSELARRLHRCFAGARYFERLLTRFSTPEELFGPLSLKALEDDRYERLIEGYLPTAGIAFLDEVFKANSAILNALLTLFNEREFDNGAGRIAAPLVCAIGASNEAPGDDSLQAFHDRFLVRVPVQPVGDARFAQLLLLGAEPAPGPAEPLTAGQVAAVAAARDAVALGDDTLAALTGLRAHAAQQQLLVSDRRWRQLVGLMRTAAVTEGRGTLDVLDLWLAPYVVGADADAVPRLAQWLAQWLGAVPQPLTGLGHAVQAFEKQLEVEHSLPPEDAQDDSAGKLSLARAIAGPDDEGGLLRIVSSALEDHLKRRFSPVHVATRLAQVDELALRVAGARQAAADALADLQARLVGRLWLPPELAGAWCGAHRQTLATADALAQRLQSVRQGFAALKVDDRLPAVAPEPVDLGG
ncbi:MAG: hypothetical protein RJA10_4319 [Pseudomonadota bacterium]|jgi:MoxR-like ATPase